MMLQYFICPVGYITSNNCRTRIGSIVAFAYLPIRPTTSASKMRLNSASRPAPRDTTQGKELTAWSFFSGSQAPGSRPDWREVAVKLASKQSPISLTVRTRLEGTAVLTRWLEITNTGHTAVVLTELSVWSGRLWSGDAPMKVGYSEKWNEFWEGWFQWKRLEDGQNIIH